MSGGRAGGGREAFVGMRRAGLLPSVGAGGSLVAAGVTVALLASGLLAFRDWPGGAARGADGTAALPGVPVKKASARRSAARTAVRASAARVAAAPARHRVRRAAADGGAIRRSSRTAPHAATPVTTPAPARATPVAAPGAASTPVSHARAAKPGPLPIATPVPVPVPVPSVGSVQQTVSNVRHAVDPVVRALPQPVQAPVQQVGDVAQGAAGTVDGVLGSAGIRLP
jgi:hypothetical protein